MEVFLKLVERDIPARAYDGIATTEPIKAVSFRVAYGRVLNR